MKKHLHHGTLQRVLSLLLALALLLSFLPAVSTAQAASSGEVTVHFYNADGWASVYGYVWESTGSNNSWPGTKLSENPEHTGWYDLKVTDTDGAFNCIFNAGNGMPQTSDIAVSHADGTTDFWYVNGQLSKTAAWDTAEDYTVTVHFKNASGWSDVYGYLWESTSGNSSWPGTKLSENEANPGWFDLEVKDTDGAFNCIFNKGEGGSGNQTSDLSVTHSADSREFWVQNDTVSATKPTGWVNTYTMYFSNPGSWSSVNAYMWDASTGSFLGTAWPGASAARNAANSGWYEATLTGAYEQIGVIFNNGSGSQTGDMLLSAAKNSQLTVWITGTGSMDYTTTAPDGWKTEAAGEKQVTYLIHYANPESWSNVNAYVWDGSTGSYIGTAWPGAAASANTEKAGWYDVSVTTTAGKLGVIFNNGSAQSDDNMIEAGDQSLVEVWVTGNGANDYVTTAPDSWTNPVAPVMYEVTVHYHNTANWDTVAGYAWDSNGSWLLGAWPGSVLNENGANTGWYDMTVGADASGIGFIFNNTTGSQTGDLSTGALSADTELWVEGSTVSTQAPSGWVTPNTVKVHFLKPDSWGTPINAYVWNLGVSGYDSHLTWPGSAVPENAAHKGWYDLIITSENPVSFNFIFNDGSSQTTDLTTGTLTGSAELWVVGDEVLTKAPGQWSGDYDYTANIHFQKPASWGSTVNAWIWDANGKIPGYEDYNTNWPGKAVEADTVNLGWYNVSVTMDENDGFNFIFNDGTNQTWT